MQLSKLNFNMNRSKFIRLVKSLTGNLIFKTTAFENPDSCKLAGFDVKWVDKWENFELPTLIFCSFFCNLLRTGKENYLSKRVGVTDHPTELNLRKVNARANSP